MDIYIYFFFNVQERQKRFPNDVIDWIKIWSDKVQSAKPSKNPQKVSYFACEGDVTK